MTKLLLGLLTLTAHFAHANVHAPTELPETTIDRVCERLLSVHLDQPEVKFQQIYNLDAALRNFTSATIVLRWSGNQAAHDLDAGVGLGADLERRPVKYLTSLIRHDYDLYTILTGTRAELLAEVEALRIVHGPHYLSFNILLWEGKNDWAKQIPVPQVVVSIKDIGAKIAKLDLKSVSESGIAIYDEQSGELFYAIPNDVVAQLPSGLLQSLRIKTSSQTSLDWNAHRVKRHRPRYLITLPQFTLASPGAFRVLREFSLNERVLNYARLSPDFEARLKSGRSKSLTERAADVGPDAASIVDFFRRDMPDVDPQGPGAALTYVTRLWPTERGDLPKLNLLKNDVRLVLAKISPAAEGRIVKAWAVLMADGHAAK